MIGDLRFVYADEYFGDGKVRKIRKLQMRYVNKEGHYGEWEDVPLVEDESQS